MLLAFSIKPVQKNYTKKKANLKISFLAVVFFIYLRMSIP